MEPRQTYQRTSLMIEGKLPPQATDLEEAVLGAILLSPLAQFEVIPLIEPDVFYVDAHNLIFTAIKDLHKQEKPIDILTVTEKLKEAGKLDIVGGAYYVSKLVNRVSSGANLIYHSQILIQKFMQREVIRLAGESGRVAFEDDCDPFLLIKNQIKELEKIFDVTERFRQPKQFSDQIFETVQQIEKAGSGTLPGITTGNPALDHITGGLMRKEVFAIAARPGMGKTVEAVTLAKAAAMTGHHVRFESLEMTATSIIKRLISSDQKIDGYKLRTGTLEQYDWISLNNSAGQLSELPITVDDRPGKTIQEIKHGAIKQKQKTGLDLLIIDFLGLIRFDRSRNTVDFEIGIICKELKVMAKELDIAIILLVQLNRDVEKRSNNRPRLSDLRDSGNIEQDVDIVAALYRPILYHTYTDREQCYGSLSEQDYAEVSEFIFLKFREGATTDYTWQRFKGEYSLFEQWKENRAF